MRDVLVSCHFELTSNMFETDTDLCELVNSFQYYNSKGKCLCKMALG